MKSILLIISCLLFCFSCRQGDVKVANSPHKPLLIVVDTTATDYLPASSQRMEQRIYHPYFIGMGSDSIFIDYWLYKNKFRDCRYSNDKKKKSSCDTIHFGDPLDVNGISARDSGAKLVLKVDTTHFIGFLDEFDSTYYKSYPVMISNKSLHRIIIGVHSALNLYLEAKDENGEWRSIEYNLEFWCGTGMTNVVILPEEVAISSAIIYSGTFKTKLRIGLGKFYSNEFSGSINPGQFVKEEQ